MVRACFEQLEPKLLLSSTSYDWAEPNDAPHSAYVLDGGSQVYGGLNIDNAWDEDWFQWTAPNSGVVDIGITPAVDQGDLDLFILDSNLDDITSSTSASSTENCSFEAQAGQTYYIDIINANGEAFPGYDLSLQFHDSGYVLNWDDLNYADAAGRQIEYGFDTGSQWYGGTLDVPDSAVIQSALYEYYPSYFIEPYQADLSLNTAMSRAELSSFNGAAYLYSNLLNWTEYSDVWSVDMTFGGFTGLGDQPSVHRIQSGLFEVGGGSMAFVQADWIRQAGSGGWEDSLELSLIVDAGDGTPAFQSPVETFNSMDPATTWLGLKVQCLDGQTIEGLANADGGDWMSIAQYSPSTSIYGLPYGAPFVWMAAQDGSVPQQQETPVVTIIASDPNAAEQGADPGQFTIFRTGGAAEALTVHYTVGGSATSADYHPALNGVATIPAGESQAVIDITPIDDALDEGDQTIILSVDANDAYSIGSPDLATVTIADNDAPAGVAGIHGTIYNDANGNGTQDPGETALAGWTIGLDSNGDGTADRTATSSATGGYGFSALTPGAYTVSEQVPTGWSATAPVSAQQTVTLAAGQDVTSDFGNRQNQPNAGQNYVVLFAGGGDASNNHSRYYKNVKRLYGVLTDQFDIPKDHIWLLASDGLDPGLDQSLYQETGTRQNINSDYSFALSSNVGAATWENLQTVMGALAPQMGANDHFFFWTYDHGSGESGNTSDTTEYLVGWNSQFIPDTNLKQLLGTVHAGYTTYAFGQCYSGGILDDLLPLPAHTFGTAATTHYEPSWGGTFIGPFTDALASGIRTTRAAFDYALAHDNRATDGQGPNATYWDYDTTGQCVEHPWAAGDDFEIFARSQANRAPDLLKVDALDAPVSQTDVTITYDDLLARAKASDPDGDSISFVIQSVVTGTLTKNGLTVTPGTTHVGPGDSVIWHRPANAPSSAQAFTVSAFDGFAASSRTLPVWVGLPATNSMANANADTATINQDASDALIDVLANDKGVGALRVARVGAANHGLATVVGGRLYYTPYPEFFGQDSFTYVMADERGNTGEADVTITINNIPHPPQAALDHFTLDSGSPALLSVLDNDYDPNLGQLTLSQASTASHGATQVVGNKVRYTPAPGYFGSDSFTYTITNGLNLTDQATVFLTVTQPPVNRAPTARITAANITKTSSSAYTFKVTYSNDVMLNTATIGAGDITVTGPNRYKQTAKFVSKTPSANARSIVATYSIPAPGGKWSKLCNGTYTIAMVTKQVADTARLFVTAGTLGTFKATIATKSTRTATAAQPVFAAQPVAWAVAVEEDTPLWGRYDQRVFADA